MYRFQHTHKIVPSDDWFQKDGGVDCAKLSVKYRKVDRVPNYSGAIPYFMISKIKW
jgi:hypothetical protein